MIKVFFGIVLGFGLGMLFLNFQMSGKIENAEVLSFQMGETYAAYRWYQTDGRDFTPICALWQREKETGKGLPLFRLPFNTYAVPTPEGDCGTLDQHYTY